MGKLRKIVGIGLAVAVSLGLVAYLLVPHAGPSNQSVVVNQPPAPSTGTGSDTSSGAGTSGGSTTPSTPSPLVRPPKLHGENSHGPKHVVCLPVNSHVQGTAQYQGANWFRGQCAQVPGANSQGHANGHVLESVVAALLGRPSWAFGH